MLKKHDNVQVQIVEQIKDVEKTLITFESFLRAETTPATVPETLATLCTAVCDAERNADLSLRAMIDSLNNGRYLPSTREDVISLATSCDKIANKCETIAKIMVFEKFRFPAEYAEDVLKILSLTMQQFRLLEEAINRLFNKLSGFLKDPSILDEIRKLESEVDTIEDTLHPRTFDLDMELAKKVQTQHLIELLCDMSDIIEDIADKIQIMLIARKV